MWSCETDAEEETVGGSPSDRSIAGLLLIVALYVVAMVTDDPFLPRCLALVHAAPPS